jgi:protein-disulfide isomerase
MRYVLLFLSVVMFGFTTAVTAAEINAASPIIVPVVAAPDASKGLSDSERAAVEGIVKDYIAKHPEDIIQAIQEMQKREQTGAEEKTKTALISAKDQIFNDPNTPVGGNTMGAVSVVEFFDYQCGYCKMSEEAVEKLLKDEKDVRFVYKDFPILGPVSTIAAKASLASVRQGKYVKFHDALMNKKDHLNEEMVYQVAKEVGIDVVKLKKDMSDEAITKIIQANVALGADIGVRGTPMFIIGDKVYPGALQYEQLKKAVDDALAVKKN